MLVVTVVLGVAGITAGVVSLIRVRGGLISLILGVATAGVGIVGTVVGLMWAFRAVANVDPSRKAVLLAEGIEVAMLSTAVGLGLGVCSVVLGAIAGSRADEATRRRKTQLSRVSGGAASARDT